MGGRPRLRAHDPVSLVTAYRRTTRSPVAAYGHTTWSPVTASNGPARPESSARTPVTPR